MKERRSLSVWQVAMMLAAIGVVAVLLGAEPLHASADELSPSPFRTAALAVTGPLEKASGYVGLDKPWQWAHQGFGGEVASGDGDLSADAGGTTTGSTTTSLVLTGDGPVSTSSSSTSSTTSSSTTSSSTTTTTLPLFTATNQLRMLVVGDSLMLQIGQALMRQSERLPALKVKVITKASSGLVRPDFYNWPDVLTRAVADFKPQVTVMLFGGNEKQNMRYEGQLLAPFSPEWTAEYTKRVGQAIDITTNSGGRVIWIGMPIMRSAKFSTTVRSLNSIYAQVCAGNPATTYIDGYTLFADAEGKYSAYLVDSSGKRRLMRESDGIHLSSAGGDRAAEAVMKVLLGFYRLEP